MADARESLRLWLGLLTCSSMVEREVRTRLRREFGATLPRFDMMAALERAPDGLSMGELSRRLMVSNGNVTGVAERLAREGLARRWSPPADRRSSRLALTARGRREFTAMAKAHQGWIEEMLAGLDAEEREALMALLAKVKLSIGGRGEGRDAA
ncbi:MAG TPA: MarR family transcriptional regulator [Alphaproteobacteria bacterium]|nr:MarR family transcriptional regulator [Alphaproteobacteria bacterium]HJN60139.1 MarR family transcriptional regulator [Alphaproteobacteria bacterium]